MNDRPQYRQSVEQARFSRPVATYGCDLTERVVELARRLPSHAVFVSRTAAWLHGIDSLPPGIDRTQLPIEIAVPRNASRPALDGVRVYRWDVPSDAVETVHGVRVTSQIRLAMDCARCLPRLEAVAIVDQLLRNGVSLDGLHKLAAERRNTRYSRRLRTVFDVVDAGAESPAESWSRCMIIDAGLPRPETQVPVALPCGAQYRLDLGYSARQLGVEYDGAEFHSDLVAARHDARRRADIRAAGWQLLVFRSDEVFLAPDGLLLKVLEGLQSRGWNPGSIRLERIRRNIRYIAMRRRLDRERWFQNPVPG